MVDLCVSKMKKQVVNYLKVILKITKLEVFNGNNFKRWHDIWHSFVYYICAK